MTRTGFLLSLLVIGLAIASPTKQLLKKRLNVSNSRVGIYNGKATTIEKHPYLVALNYYGTQMCAASIVSDSWVLTSADCVYGESPSAFTLLAGSQDGTSGGTLYNVTDVVTHPSFVIDSFDYDYGLLKINGTFKWSSKVKAVNLPTTKAKTGTKLIVSGWGVSKEANAALLQGETKVISNKECEKIFSGYSLTITNRMLCTYNKGKTAPCPGDFADPITKNNILHSLVVGIATSGECSKSALPTVGVNVHTAVPWIQNVTGLAFN